MNRVRRSHAGVLIALLLTLGLGLPAQAAVPQMVLPVPLIPIQPASSEPRLVQDFSQRSESSRLDGYAALDDALILNVYTQYYGQSLWRTDGTPSGTYRIEDFAAADRVQHMLGAHNSLAFFTVFDRDESTQIWRTNGEPGSTLLLKTLDEGWVELLGSVGPYLLIEQNLPDDIDPICRLWASDGTPQGTQLVQEFEMPDIGPGLTMSDTIYFQAYDRLDNSQLWRSDGTPAGTWMVKEFTSGGGGKSFLNTFTQFQGRLYFFRINHPTPDELWVSDGTASGTQKVIDLPDMPSYLKVVEDHLYFITGNSEASLWVSDGSSAGTKVIKEFNSMARILGDVNGRLLFVAGDQFEDQYGELWASDGTSTGTLQLKDIYPGEQPSIPFLLLADSGQAFFSANDPEHGRELWVTDGTPANTHLVKDIQAGPGSGIENDALRQPGSGGSLFFSANDGQTGAELWQTDGSAAGTRLVKDICPGECSSNPWLIHWVQGRLILRANDSVHGDEPWYSDGTSAGTQLLKDLDTIGGSAPDALTVVGDELYSAVSLSYYQRAWWKTNGATQQAQEIEKTPLNEHVYPMIAYAQAWGDQLLYQLETDAYGLEWWRSDGTAAGTDLLKDINPGPGSGPLGDMARWQGGLYFTAQSGREAGLWKTDGTPEGTQLMLTFPITETEGVKLATVKAARDFLYVLTTTQTYSGLEMWDYTNSQLWRTRGTPATTELIMSLPDSQGWDPGNTLLATLDNRLFLRQQFDELWLVDAQDANSPVTVSKLLEGIFLSRDPAQMHLWKRLFIFSGTNDTQDAVLLRSDGTLAGTFILKSWPANEYWEVEALESQVLFTAADAEHGQELWRTDGKLDGTQLVKDIWPGKERSSSASLVQVRGRLHFQAADGVHGVELWESDGTPAGTQMLADLNPGELSSWPSEMTLFKNGIYFSADREDVGRELWALDLPEYGNAVYLPVVAQR